MYEVPGIMKRSYDRYSKQSDGPSEMSDEGISDGHSSDSTHRGVQRVQRDSNNLWPVVLAFSAPAFFTQFPFSLSPPRSISSSRVTHHCIHGTEENTAMERDPGVGGEKSFPLPFLKPPSKLKLSYCYLICVVHIYGCTC